MCPKFQWSTRQRCNFLGTAYLKMECMQKCSTSSNQAVANITMSWRIKLSRFLTAAVKSHQLSSPQALLQTEVWIEGLLYASIPLVHPTSKL